jgi:hypothetical protein
MSRMSRTSIAKARRIVVAVEMDGRMEAIAVETVAGAEAVRAAVVAEAVEDAAVVVAAAAVVVAGTAVATADMVAEEGGTSHGFSRITRIKKKTKQLEGRD